MQDMLASTLYRPTMSAGLILIVLVAALLPGLLAARRERVWWPVIFRFVGVVALAWVLLGYSQTQPSNSSTASPPKLVILADTSQSMAEVDVVVSPNSPATSRLLAVQGAYLNGTQLDKLREFADVEASAFDEQVRPTQLFTPDGQSTALYRAVSQSKADATLILSDGHDTTRQGPAGDFAGAGRLFAVPVGAARSAPDLVLQAWPDSDRLFEDQSTTITANIRQSGLTGRQAVVELLLEDNVIATHDLTLAPRAETVRFEVTPPLETGRTVQANLYTARIRLTQGEEAYTDNNAESLAIQTSRGQIKVLLLEGEPYWDTRSLARLITDHPRFDLTARYGFGNERRGELIGETVDPNIDPVQQLDTFDIVILGRQVQRLVDPAFAQRLTTHVRGGGAVVFARGQPYEIESGELGQEGFAFARGLESISPVDWAQPVLGEMRVRLGDADDPSGPLAGLKEGEVLTRLPGMIAATQIRGRKTASLVMLEQSTDNGPALAAMTSLRVGSGISMAVLSEGLWRWELLPGVEEQDSEIESIYGVLWVRALQWLASGGEFLPGQDIALQADRVTADLDQPINLRISTRYVESDGLNLKLKVTQSDGGTEQLTPTTSDTSGTYTATFEPRQTGNYTIQLTAPGRDDLIAPDQPLTTRVVVIDRSPERRDTSAKPEALKQLVEPTGGECLDLGEIDPVVDYLQTLQALRRSEDTVDYAFNTWPVFALIAGCFGLEWIFRRRMGLR
jgi:hypothetical protein